MIFCRLLTFSKLFFSKKKFWKHYLSVKQFGSRSGPIFCQSWSGSKLFAKVISRRQMSQKAGKELKVYNSLKCAKYETCPCGSGQKLHSSARDYEWNLERQSDSSQSTHPTGVLWEELLKEVILHITPLCSLLHTLLKDKCMGLQDVWKL